MKSNTTNNKVFISYSWDNDAHKQWVLDLANLLIKNGIDVILDRYELSAGKSLQHFIENAVSESNRIIIVYTPNYKLKADKREGGVGYEYSIINIGLYKDITGQGKIIPILRQGSIASSIPEFMQQFIHIDFSNDRKFSENYEELLREIYKEPKIKKPQIGEKPNFESNFVGVKKNDLND
ncbi:toll/interleukin-1 receptor domain-containing protein [Taibaiella koreensis]|uniref:toll/interleukin-1 receptor domain-containing protein n=1 Tax=Taibaiella koreensis TaxID=1268548 RepID=UPI000E59DE72|nr:toll/interleukin-1 receptor domain-containing protein [Taibaiella koreensis]